MTLSSRSLPLVSTHRLVSSACRSTQLVKIARKARIEARTTRIRTLIRCRVSGGSGEAMTPRTLRSGWDGLQTLLDPFGRGDVLVHAELLRLEAQGEADELGEVENRQPQVPIHDLRRLGLLHVEVEVAERARGDQAVGIGVDRVPDVRAGLTQRDVAGHCDDGEAAALPGAVVLDDLAAERLDQAVEVEVALGVLLVTEAMLRAQDVAAVEGADPEAVERLGHLFDEAIETVVLDQHPEEVLVGEALGVVREALFGEGLVD